MMKIDVINMYEMEELIPIVGKLAEEFTAKESSSVTYERARQFMEAVIYCMAHSETGDNSITTGRFPAMDVYQLGRDAVIQKVRETQEKYNELMRFFEHYDNRNYRDTVEKALPAFFLYYDVKFAPMENIITMDYPILGLDMKLEGIDMIEQYIDAIWEEQRYLLQLPRNHVISLLRSFHPHYENEYFNIKEIVELQRKDYDIFSPSAYST